MSKSENINNLISKVVLGKKTQHLLHNENWISGTENIASNAKHQPGRTKKKRVVFEILRKVIF